MPRERLEHPVARVTSSSRRSRSMAPAAWLAYSDTSSSWSAVTRRPCRRSRRWCRARRSVPTIGTAHALRMPSGRAGSSPRGVDAACRRRSRRRRCWRPARSCRRRRRPAAVSVAASTLAPAQPDARPIGRELAPVEQVHAQLLDCRAADGDGRHDERQDRRRLDVGELVDEAAQPAQLAAGRGVGLDARHERDHVVRVDLERRRRRPRSGRARSTAMRSASPNTCSMRGTRAGSPRRRRAARRAAARPAASPPRRAPPWARRG